MARTPIGRRRGNLSGWHPVDLAAHVIETLVSRNDLDPSLVDDVILGCVSQIGEQALNVARNAALAAGLPESVPGTTVDRQCGSAQQAIHFAAQGVMAGVYDMVIAGGVESMSRVPMGSAIQLGPGLPFGPRMSSRYEMSGGLVPQGVAAERVAEAYKLQREALDTYSIASHQRAVAAVEEGRFDKEIVALSGDRQKIREDEGVRRDTSLAALGALKPAFEPEGRITAGNSSQISDGAAAVLITSEARAAALGLVPRARFVAFSVVGSDPLMMLTGAAPATTRVLERAGLGIADIDRFEVNEAFAAVVLAWEHDVHADMSRVNVNGGAIALGHPLGASGARLAATLVCDLERGGGRYGLQTMCEGGGMANAMILERL